MSALTEPQRTALQYMIDEEWHLGAALAVTGSVLRALDRRGYIIAAGDDVGYMRDMWRITQAGLDAVHARAEA